MERILTVVTPATSFALTTLAAVQGDLGAAAVGVADPVFTGLIDEASGAIARYCDRVFAREVVSEAFRRTTRRIPEMLALSRRPVTAIASVTEDGVVLAGTDWELDSERGFLYRLTDDARSHWSGTKIVVAYTGGWTLPDVVSPTLPPEVNRACRVAVVTWFLSRSRDGRLRSESADGLSSQSWLDPRAQDGALPFETAALLQPFGGPGI